MTSVKSVDHVFIQLAKDSVKLESLLDQLDETYAYLPPGALDLTQEPVVGQACCACYSNVWYRARIQEIHQDSTLLVCFVDSGRLEMVDFKNVKQAIPELLDTRPLAVECCMVGCREKHLGNKFTFIDLLILSIRFLFSCFICYCAQSSMILFQLTYSKHYSSITCLRIPKMKESSSYSYHHFH